MKFIFFKTLLLTTLLIISGCASSRDVSYYDSTTYKNLTDLKPQVIFVYETFKEDQIQKHDINQVKLKFAQAYEYEVGKGASNEDTTNQLTELREIFDTELKSRIEDGKWTELIYTNSVKLITKAFDKAIKSESLKNKPKE